MTVNVKISRHCKKWNQHSEISDNMIAETIGLTLSKFKNIVSIEKLEISVLLTDDKEMKNLNLQFRGKSKPTDVLSFPGVELNWKSLPYYNPLGDQLYLGNIAFGYDTVDKLSKKMVFQFENYFNHLLVHATLHLLGYDHVDDDDAEAMQALEKEVLRELAPNIFR